MTGDPGVEGFVGAPGQVGAVGLIGASGGSGTQGPAGSVMYNACFRIIMLISVFCSPEIPFVFVSECWYIFQKSCY